jgi:DNA excision repair protein ERCC-4
MSSTSKSKPQVINLIDENEDDWDALDEIDGRIGVKAAGTTRTEKKSWIPEGMDPVLEELPKWSLLADILQEIEEEMMRQESLGGRPSACKCFTFVVLGLH